MLLATGPPLAQSAHALDQIFRQTDVDLSGESQRLENATFDEGQPVAAEEGDGMELPGWKAWQEGYVIVPGAGRDGTRAIQCSLTDKSLQCGAGQRVELNQEEPHPVVASAWSRAQDVSGSPDTGYSIYLDFIFKDGTTWWAQTANFSTGTHDWEERQFIVVPKKPIRSVYVYCIFRNHTGTVYFDDVRLLELKGETYMYEGVPVRPQPVRAPVEKVWIPYMQTRNGLQMALERKRARICGVWVNQEKVGLNGPGFFARDAAAKSDFLAPWDWEFDQQDSTLLIKGEVEPLDLELTAAFTTREDRITVNGMVEDTSGEERAVTVYFGIPVDDSGWIWCDTPRSSLPATATIYTNTRTTVAGATGKSSVFPIGAIYKSSQETSRKRGVAMGVPLNDPRHHRIGFDSRTGLFYIAFDFGLSPTATSSPGKATFDFVIFPFSARWDFRGALSAYYRMYPEFYQRRAPIEGLWLPKTDIASIENPDDFFFAYHSTRGNVGLRARPSLLSFVYSDPANVWVPMPQDMARSREDAIAYLSQQSTMGAQQVAASGLLDEVGRPVAGIAEEPWCSGAVFAVNPDPELPNPSSKGKLELDSVVKRLGGQGDPVLLAWPPLEGGYAIDDDAHGGDQALRVETSRDAPRGGAAQRVDLNQTEPQQVELRGYVRTEGLKNGEDDACVVSVTAIDGEGNAYTEAIPVGQTDGEFTEVKRTVKLDKPIAGATVKFLLHDERGATAWFDDFVLSQGGGEANLLKDGDMESEPSSAGGMAGVYVNDLGAWATRMNYNENHFASADIPLVYDNHTRKIGMLNTFSTYEYLRLLAELLHNEGKLVMATGASLFPAHLVDVFCMEVDWCRDGRWYPTDDERLLELRVMSRQKPVCLVMNTDFESLLLEPIPSDMDLEKADAMERKPSLEMVDRYMRYALFYGMFPGFFSEDGATNPFFENPEWYNKVRPLYQKYLPLIQQLSTAGWEPITGAECQNEQVYLERYGAADQGQVFIAARYGDQRWQEDAEEDRDVRAELNQPITAEIEVSTAYIGMLGEENIEVFDMLGEQPVEFRQEQSKLFYTITLPPYGVHLARIRPALR